MNLGFSRQLKIGDRVILSFFKEKIMICLNGWTSNMPPKKHTIRDDLKDRWRSGMHIHFMYGIRASNISGLRDMFHIGKCTGIEYIAIVYPPCCGFTVYVFDESTKFGKKLNEEEISQLAINDGFDTVEDFKAYFNQDFRGKLIHWTDTRYAQ